MRKPNTTNKTLKLPENVPFFMGQTIDSDLFEELKN